MSGSPRFAHGYGLQTIAADGSVLDTWFPAPALGDGGDKFDPHIVPPQIEQLEQADEFLGVHTRGIGVRVNLDVAPEGVSDAYLRLHLLSHTLSAPNSINLEGIFSVLPVVAFTNRGAIHPDTLESRQVLLRQHGVHVVSLDKFPPMLDYVRPQRVRIADASRVRLGAHLAPGTTVMHEGFVNFNAGTLGASMVEGRISQGVTIGEGTDIGGGASIMGTLSGGGSEVISIGRRCLLGANSGVGISLGDDCVVEAGLYLTAGSKVEVHEGASTTVVKAQQLSAQPGILFRRNSQTGAIEALPRQGHGIRLNQALHN